MPGRGSPVPDEVSARYSMADTSSGTLTFLFTDLESSTWLWEQHPEAMGAAVARHDALLRAAILAHGGQILVSAATAALARGELPPDAGLRDLGRHRLRDLGGPEQIFQVVHAGLTTDFPPIRTLEAHSHNLPIQLTSFIGRAKELAELVGLLSPKAEGGRRRADVPTP